MKRVRFLILSLIGILSLGAFGAEDLKTYYENRKAELIPTFEAPRLGSQVTVKIASGHSRTGILMKLSAGSISLMSDTGTTVNYDRAMLHESSRTVFFAEDYAHVKALELTREYKQSLYEDQMAEDLANVHDGEISVSAKPEKSSDKKVETKENENKRTGEINTTRTFTRTDTEVQKLKVSVINKARHPDTFTLKYYFFSERIAKNVKKQKKKKDEAEIQPGTLSIKSQAQKNVTVEARGRERVELASDPFAIVKIELENQSGNITKEPTVSGDENAGWLVILLHGGTVLDAKASHKAYLSDEWIAKYR